MTTTPRSPEVKAFFDPATYTITYVIHAPGGKQAAVIDPVLDFDPRSGKTSTVNAEKVAAYIREQGLELRLLLETHAHADHLSASPWLQDRLGGEIVIGAHITEVQKVFKNIFNLEKQFLPDGRQFDRLVGEGDTLTLDGLEIRILHTPGHTPACVTYVVGDAAFVGDTLFMPDYGTARCDFPGGDAATLYESIRKILSLPDDTRLFMCHDYGTETRREFAWETTVAEERAKNIHIREGVSKDEFIRLRKERDSKLAAPVLLWPSVQVNIRAGHFPPAEDNGMVYLKIPVNAI